MSRTRLLVALQNFASLELCEIVFTALGYETVAVGSYCDALMRLRSEQKFDLVIVELTLSSATRARELIMWCNRHYTRVIAIGEPGDARRSFPRPMLVHGLIERPFAMVELINLGNRVMKLRPNPRTGTFGRSRGCNQAVLRVSADSPLEQVVLTKGTRKRTRKIRSNQSRVDAASLDDLARILERARAQSQIHRPATGVSARTDTADPSGNAAGSKRASAPRAKPRTQWKVAPVTSVDGREAGSKPRSSSIVTPLPSGGKRPTSAALRRVPGEAESSPHLPPHHLRQFPDAPAPSPAPLPQTSPRALPALPPAVPARLRATAAGRKPAAAAPAPRQRTRARQPACRDADAASANFDPRVIAEAAMSARPARSKTHHVDKASAIPGAAAARPARAPRPIDRGRERRLARRGRRASSTNAIRVDTWGDAESHLFSTNAIPLPDDDADVDIEDASGPTTPPPPPTLSPARLATEGAPSVHLFDPCSAGDPFFDPALDEFLHVPILLIDPETHVEIPEAVPADPFASPSVVGVPAVAPPECAGWDDLMFDVVVEPSSEEPRAAAPTAAAPAGAVPPSTLGAPIAHCRSGWSTPATELVEPAPRRARTEPLTSDVTIEASQVTRGRAAVDKLDPTARARRRRRERTHHASSTSLHMLA